MRLVIDTNIFLTCVSRKSPYHWIFENIISERIELCVTTEILLEYEEIIERHMGAVTASNAIKAVLRTASTERISVYYKWGLIKDKDDNKFVDCAIAANARYLVSNDKDFNVLKKTAFPKLDVISYENFRNKFQSIF